MEELEQLKDKLSAERPVSWAEFPDIGLYMDQVISYMHRQLINFEGASQITSAMVNNYIKDKLLPRADGKKYSREHLAGLTEIGLLKQVLSVSDVGLLLHQELGEDDHEKFYFKFRQILDKALAVTAEQIKPDWEMEALSDMALRLVVSSYCNKLAGERLLEIISSKVNAEEQKKPDKKTDNKPDRKADRKLNRKQERRSDKKPRKPDAIQDNIQDNIRDNIRE
jgi:hypothetical protein